MSELMFSNFIEKLFNIRAEERVKSYLMFAYIFLIIASLLILKPIRNSIFLVNIGIYQLPYAYTLVAITAILFIKVYSIYSNRIRLNILIRYTLVFFMVTLSIIWFMLHLDYQAKWFLYAIFIWVAIFGVVVTSQFWLLANYVFNAREAKRLFGFIGAGGISGGIFGGYLTNLVAPIIGTEQMMFFCLCFWFICLLILGVIWKETARFNYDETIIQNKRLKEAIFSSGPLKTVLQSRHLLYIAGIVGVGALVAAFVDYQYSYIASEQISGKDDLTAFFGFWLSNLSFISLLFQFFLTSRILKYFGITASLHLLPIGISLGALGILISPSLISAIAVKVAEGSFKQSVNKAGVELLYLPISSHIKNQAKAFIDVSVDGFATGIGGLLLIILVNNFYFSVQSISLFTIIFIGIWLYFIYQVRKEYIQSFRIALEKRDIDLDQQNINLEDAGIFEMLMKVLQGNSDRQIIYVLNLLEGNTEPKFIPVFLELLQHPRQEIRIQSVHLLGNYKDHDFSAEISRLSQDTEHQVRIEVARYLISKSSEPAVIINNLLSITDVKIVSSVLIAIAMEYREKHITAEIVNPNEIIDSQIEKSIAIDLSKDEQDFIKINLAKFIGIMNEKNLNPLLFSFLQEQSDDVIIAAIQSAGMTRDSLYYQRLFQYLSNKKLRKYVREALSEYGESIVPELAKNLMDPDLDELFKISLVRILSRIGSQSAVNLLWAHMNMGTLALRFQTIKALNKLNLKFSLLKFGKKRIDKQIRIERDHYLRNISALKLFRQILILQEKETDPEIERARQLLTKALNERLDNILEIIFRLLGLKYASKDIYNSYLGISSGRNDLQANAIEFLDNVLDVTLKPLIIPLVEGYSFPETPHQQSRLDSVVSTTEQKVLKEILDADDNWLKLCSLYLIAKIRNFDYIPFLKSLRNDSDIRVQEMTEYALNTLPDVSNN
jgi:AAA family ATP:ADP antiporter